jgi:hypothetical protein
MLLVMGFVDFTLLIKSPNLRVMSLYYTRCCSATTQFLVVYGLIKLPIISAVNPVHLMCNNSHKIQTILVNIDSLILI